MANTFINPSVVAKEATMILENNLVATNLFHRGHTEEWSGAKKGDTISIRTPASFTAQEFTSTTTTQNITESSANLVLEKHFDVTVELTAKHRTLNLNDFSGQVVSPAMAAIAQGIDAYVLGKCAEEIPNYVGTAGDPPDSIADLAAVEKKLNDLKIPMADRFAIVNTQAKADLIGLEPVYSAEKRADAGTALRTAEIGEVMGMQFYMSQNVDSHDATPATSWLINNGSGYAAGSTTVAVDGGSGAPVVGDVFSVAGDTTQHVVTAYSSPNVTFSPGLGSAIVDNAALTFVADHVVNVAGHPFGTTVAIVPLEIPNGADGAYIADRNLGVRVVYDYAASTKTETISFDVLCGAKVQQPGLLTRVLG